MGGVHTGGLAFGSHPHLEQLAQASSTVAAAATSATLSQLLSNMQELVEAVQAVRVAVGAVEAGGTRSSGQGPLSPTSPDASAGQQGGVARPSSGLSSTPEVITLQPDSSAHETSAAQQQQLLAGASVAGRSSLGWRSSGVGGVGVGAGADVSNAALAATLRGLVPSLASIEQRMRGMWGGLEAQQQQVRSRGCTGPHAHCPFPFFSTGGESGACLGARVGRGGCVARSGYGPGHEGR